MLLNCSHFVTLETSGRFSDVSRRYRKRPMVWNVLKWRFLRKQPPEVFYKKGVRKIHRKVPDHSFFFDEVAGVKRATSSKKRRWNTFGWLLLFLSQTTLYINENSHQTCMLYHIFVYFIDIVLSRYSEK